VRHWKKIVSCCVVSIVWLPGKSACLFLTFHLFYDASPLFPKFHKRKSHFLNLSLFFLTYVLRMSAALFKGNLEPLSSIFLFFVLPAICDLLIGSFSFRMFSFERNYGAVLVGKRDMIKQVRSDEGRANARRLSFGIFWRWKFYPYWLAWSQIYDYKVVFKWLLVSSF